MTFARVTPKRGFVSVALLARGPNGRALCRYCGTEVPKGRFTFCGIGCIHEWKMRSNPGYARDQVEKRDGGLCAICGVVDPYWEADHIVPVIEGGGECGLDGYRTLCRQHHRQATRELAARRAAARRRLPLGP